jgi:hypothetical protein
MQRPPRQRFSSNGVLSNFGQVGKPKYAELAENDYSGTTELFSGLTVIRSEHHANPAQSPRVHN